MEVTSWDSAWGAERWHFMTSGDSSTRWVRDKAVGHVAKLTRYDAVLYAEIFACMVALFGPTVGGESIRSTLQPLSQQGQGAAPCVVRVFSAPIS
eukprot:4347917-Amphidinium_carterae.1